MGRGVSRGSFPLFCNLLFFFSWDSTSFFIIRKSFCHTDILPTAGPQARTDNLLEILPAEVTFKNCSSELKPDVTIQLDGFALFL